MFENVSIKGIRKITFYIIGFLLLGIVGFKLLTAFYPLEHFEQIKKYSRENGLRTEFVYAVIHAESRFDHEAVSNKGATGLMQLLKITAEWGASELQIDGFEYGDVLDPDINIRIGCWYLQKLLKQYDGSEFLTLAAYNAGSGNVSGWIQNGKISPGEDKIENIPFPETRNYIKKVRRNEMIYKAILFFTGGSGDE